MELWGRMDLEWVDRIGQQLWDHVDRQLWGPIGLLESEFRGFE